MIELLNYLQLKFLNFARKHGLKIVACLMLVAIFGLHAYSQQKPMNQKPPAAVKTQNEPEDTGAMEEEEELPHAFFTHEGLPDAVGSFSLRTSALVMRTDGATKGDFAFHLETGLTKRIGLHIRNDRFLDNTRSEVMFQYAAITSKNGQSGFAPIIEFEFPTRRGGGSRINTLVGFTTKFANSRSAFNSVVHYNPREDMVESSASFVFKAGSSRFYPVIEVLTEFARREGPVISLVGGLKVRVSKKWIVGFGFQAPVTTRKDFSSQAIFQSENMLVRKR
jgi:hypothetical protein